ncbi:amidase family protein [Gangjinia marincola]|uniref:Amidase family protein n=1 Tax=Gangjinia marincola TaxID=578463 RepID=A0ABP3XV00_9FLAO
MNKVKVHLGYLIFLIIISSCKNEAPTPETTYWTAYDETTQLAENANHENPRMRYKLIQSYSLDKNTIWADINKDLKDFSEDDYAELKSKILENDIESLQQQVTKGELSYEDITKFYLYRIRKLESDSLTTLHTVLALNTNAVSQAQEKDANRPTDLPNASIYGLPVLLKDNVNTKTMRTTAGAIALENNQPKEDAYIVDRLKENGALILGKVNLSEWAYFFCSGCPVGYSAVGGQTLNPYGPKKFETGGSSAGSGTAMAANYAVAAVGTETAGSILSPSSQNSVVGLKPTVGTLSRTGIVPISSTLDTPGPMTRTVRDNLIFMQAMLGKDEQDKASSSSTLLQPSELNPNAIKSKRLGAFKSLIENDSLYRNSIAILRENGVEVIEVEQPQVPLEGFLTLLNIDMREDLPVYLKQFSGDSVSIASVADVIKFNREDSLKRAPYGQTLFNGIVSDTTSTTDFSAIKKKLHTNGRLFFDQLLEKHDLDGILSINNYHAAYAAVALYPALTVPMGYQENGEPKNLTFIASANSENALYQMGYGFEQLTQYRKAPKGYE